MWRALRGGPCPRLCAAAAALLLAHPRPAHPSTRGWAPYSLSAQRAGARTAALTSGSGSRPTAAPTHTEQHAQDSHRTLPLTPLTATGYSDLITGTSLSTPCTRLPVAVASAASCPDQTPIERKRSRCSRVGAAARRASHPQIPRRTPSRGRGRAAGAARARREARGGVGGGGGAGGGGHGTGARG